MANRIDDVFRASAPALRGVAIRALLVTGLMAAASSAQAQAAGDRAGYLATGDGRPVADAFGDCWHTREWTPGMYYRGCDARPVKAARAVPVKVEPKTAIQQAKILPAPVPFKIAVDTLFDFDRATLKPQGRALLDKFAARIGRADYRTIDVVGHTDRIGSAAYNRRLSARRADVVRDYLVARGLDAQKLSAEGKGSSEPVTAAGQCSGMHGKDLIQCLQPDRYAELKVAGSAPNAAIGRAIQGLESEQTAALTLP